MKMKEKSRKGLQQLSTSASASDARIRRTGSGGNASTGNASWLRYTLFISSLDLFLNVSCKNCFFMYAHTSSGLHYQVYEAWYDDNKKIESQLCSFSYALFV